MWSHLPMNEKILGNYYWRCRNVDRGIVLHCAFRLRVCLTESCVVVLSYPLIVAIYCSTNWFWRLMAYTNHSSSITLNGYKVSPALRLLEGN